MPLLDKLTEAISILERENTPEEYRKALKDVQEVTKAIESVHVVDIYDESAVVLNGNILYSYELNWSTHQIADAIAFVLGSKKNVIDATDIAKTTDEWTWPDIIMEAIKNVR